MTWLSLCEVLVLFFWWVFSLPAGGYLTWLRSTGTWLNLVVTLVTIV